MSWAMIGAAAISAGVGIYSSHQAKKKSKSQKSAEQQQLEMMKFLGPYGQRMLTRGEQTMELPLGFYSRLAGGDRNTMLQTLQPELNAYNESERSSLGSLNEMAPRGGAGGDALSRLPFRRASNMQNLVFGARTSAMDNLAKMGQNMQSTGLNAISGGQAGASGLLNFGLQRNNQAFEQGMSSGAGTYELIRGIMDSYQKNKTQNQSNPWGSTGQSSPSSMWSVGGWGR